jgi:hypothetical protein
MENAVRKLLEQHLARISEVNRRETSSILYITESEEALAAQGLTGPNSNGRLKPSSPDLTITLNENGRRLLFRVAKYQYNSDV